MSDHASDILEIQRLLSRYCLLLDEENFDEWQQLFTADAELHAFRQIWRGPAEIVEHISQADPGLHMAGVPTIEVDGDRATSIQNFLFVELDGHALRLGAYIDELVRRDGAWLIASRRIRMLKRKRPEAR